MTENPKMKKSIKLSPSEITERNRLVKKLQENGDFERLKGSLYAQLMLDDTWREGIVKDQTRETVKQSGGRISEITLDELSDTLIQKGVVAVPESVRDDLLSRIRHACASHHHNHHE